MVGVCQDSTLLHQQRYLQACQQLEKSMYYSVDTTDQSTISNASVYDDHSGSNTAPTNNNRRSSGNNINRNTTTSSTVEERRNKYHSKFSMVREKNAGSKTTSFDTNQEDYMRNEDLSATTEFLDRNFSPFSNEPPLIQKEDGYGDVAVAPGILLQNSSRSTRGPSAFIKTSKSETHLGSTRTRYSNDHRDSTNTRKLRSVSRSRPSQDYHNNKIEEEQEEERQDNSFHLGLEPMETDLSSMTDTIYSLNSTYQNYLKNNVTKKTRCLSFDNHEHEHQKRHNVETISETNEHQPINGSLKWQQSQNNYETEVVHSSRSYTNSNTATHYDNFSPSKATNSNNQTREPYYVEDGGSFDSAIDAMNDIINERKNIKKTVSTSIPKRLKNNPRNTSKYDSKMETPRRSNAKQQQIPKRLKNNPRNSSKYDSQMETPRSSYAKQQQHAQQYQRMSNIATVPSLSQFKRDNPRDLESSSSHTDLLHPSPMRLIKQPPITNFPASTNGDTRTQSTETFSRAVSQNWATVAVNETEVVHSSMSNTNRNTATHYDNFSPSKATNSNNQTREAQYVEVEESFDSAIDTINNIINERKNIKRPVSATIPKRLKSNPRNTSKYDSKMETPRSSNAKQQQHPQQYQRMSNNATVPTLTQFRRDNPRDVESLSSHTDLLHPSPMRLFKQLPTTNLPASTNGDTRKKTTENFSRAVSQDWATVAVNVAVSILESGESQEIAEAATAAVLSVGGSAMLNKSSALEAAAEASTAALSVGCSQTTAATVAVAVLKASKIIPNRAGNKLEVQKSRSFDSIDSLTEECTITSKARSSYNLSLGINNLSSNDFTETDYYMNDERDTPGSCYEEREQRTTISHRNCREIRSIGSGEDERDIILEEYSKINHDTCSSFRTDDDDMYESSTLLTYQSFVINSHDMYCFGRNQRKEREHVLHNTSPSLTHALYNLYQNLCDGCTEFVFQSSIFLVNSFYPSSRLN